MTLRKAAITGFVSILLLSLASCGAFRRVGKDLTVVLTSPAVILYGASTDAYTSAKEVREGYQANAAVEVISMPFLGLWHGLKHLCWVGVHALDVPLFLVYGPADLHPYGPEIEPLDYYTGTWLDGEEGEASGLDAESGDSLDR